MQLSGLLSAKPGLVPFLGEVGVGEGTPDPGNFWPDGDNLDLHAEGLRRFQPGFLLVVRHWTHEAALPGLEKSQTPKFSSVPTSDLSLRDRLLVWNEGPV